ncbi:MAG TPA: glycosyltransferase family 4 protein [Vicingus sp.]|nr:glycosyltransferase family 4 protein [Vicingus sp.]
MNILQLCSKVPFPPKDGGSIAMDILTQGLIKAGNKVDVLAINTSKHFTDINNVDENYKKITNYQLVFIDTEVKPLDAFLNLFTSKSYNVIRFYSKSFENVLIECLQKNVYDIIQLETLWVAPYLPTSRKNSKAKVVLRSQNIEFMIWERLAIDTKNPLKKRYLKLLAKRLKTYEYKVLNSFDAILTITEIDSKNYKKMGCTIPIHHVPFGIDLENYKIDQSELIKPSVFHIGAMDWRPNADGINWFLKSIWLKVVEQNKTTKLFLAGRNMPEWLLNFKMENVVIEGEVANSHQFINSKSIMIVPLNSGGGMRVKIIEGMAFGKTIISTAIGAEGIDYTNNTDLIIANTEQEFVDAILKCINNQDFADLLGENARKLAETKYDNQLICSKLTDFYTNLMS